MYKKNIGSTERAAFSQKVAIQQPRPKPTPKSNNGESHQKYRTGTLSKYLLKGGGGGGLKRFMVPTSPLVAEIVQNIKLVVRFAC